MSNTCKSLTLKGIQCRSTKIGSKGLCGKHQLNPILDKASMPSKPKKTSKKRVSKVDTSVTPELLDVETVQKAIDLVKSLVSDKQFYQVFKAAKRAASKAVIDFPYQWSTQKANMARIIRHIPRATGSEALDAAFKQSNDGPALELIRQYGIQEQATSETVDIDVSQRQALGNVDTAKVSNGSQTDAEMFKEFQEFKAFRAAQTG